MLEVGQIIEVNIIDINYEGKSGLEPYHLWQPNMQKKYMEWK